MTVDNAINPASQVTQDVADQEKQNNLSSIDGGIAPSPPAVESQPLSESNPPVKNLFQSKLTQLQNAGFNQSEIQDWTNKTSGKLLSAGYSPEEINDYMGLKTPDMSGVQNTIQKNLVSNQQSENPETAQDKQPPSFSESLDKGFGMPVSKMMAASVPDFSQKTLPPDIRAHLANCYLKGTANDFADFMQCAVPAAAQTIKPENAQPMLLPAATMAGIRAALNIAPTAADQAISKNTTAPYDFNIGMPNIEKIAGKTVYGLTSGAPVITGAVGGGLAGGDVGGPVGAVVGSFGGAALIDALKNINPIFQEQLKVYNGNSELAWQAAKKELAVSSVGSGLSMALFGISPFENAAKNILFQALGVQPTVGAAQQVAKNKIEGKPLSQNIAQAAGEASVGTAVPMVAHATTEFASPQLKEIVAPKVNKTPDAVTNSDIAGVIRKTFIDVAPKAQDFKDVAAVLTGHENEQTAGNTLLEIYKDTGITPEQVHEDAQINPKIIEDLSVGKIPDIYKTEDENTLQKQDNADKETSRAIAQIHEVDAEHTPPEQAMAVRDTIRQEADELAKKDPEVYNAITSAIETGRITNSLASDNRASQPAGVIEESSLSPEKSSTVGESRGNTGAESTPVRATEFAGNEQSRSIPPYLGSITPEHQELENKFGTPEDMGKSQIGRVNNIIENIFSNSGKDGLPKSSDLTDAQFEALEDYGRRIDDVKAALSAPKNKFAAMLADESGSITLGLPNNAKEFVDDIKRDILNFSTPMETGSNRARAAAKDFANNIRKTQWTATHIIDYMRKNFMPEELKTMWEAMDQSSVHVQTQEANGMSRTEAMADAEKNKVGHFNLPEDQQILLKSLSDWAQAAWNKAKELKMVEGEGLPFWTPRMAAVIGDDGKWGSPNLNSEKITSINPAGRNLTTSSSSLKNRKYLTAAETEAAMKKLFSEGEGEGDDVTLARDIRTMPLALARLEQAIAGRALIQQVKELSKDVGGDTVKDSPSDGFFTIDHPAFQTFKPKLIQDENGKWNISRDEQGNEQFEKTPIYVSKEFEGPLKSVLSQDSSSTYKALMMLKGKAMSMIMYSPLIHNAVEWGRALPAMPGKVLTFKAYFDGNAAKKDPVQMQEAIDAGLVPIGSRFFNQDISSIMEDPDLTPGRSWTSKLLGGIAESVNEKAGETVKKTIDDLGNLWHNTLLWDRVGDLQMGLYTNLRDKEVANGMDPKAAQVFAANAANRFAGALPMESMGNMARKMANVGLFSRSFTIGNLGVMKDMITGLPSDVKSQLIRDVGEENAKAASKATQRKATAAFAMDIALMYAGNSVLQDSLDKMKRDKSMSQIVQGYVDRWHKLINDHAGSPWDLLNLPHDLQALSSTSSNEPGKENRIHFSDDPKTGTAYYMRLPTGKIGEEFMGWLTSPLDMLRKKTSTIAGPLADIYKNENYFGHPIYDKEAAGVSGAVENIGKVVKYFMEKQIPEESLISSYKILTGSNDNSLDAMKAFGPLAGLTFSKGYPGGPEAGILAAANRRNEAEISATLPKVKESVEAGDTDKAHELLTALGMRNSEQKRLIKHYQDPSSKVNAYSLKKFERIATPEEKELMHQQEDTGNTNP